MLDVRAVVEPGQIANQPQSADWPPVDVFNQAVVDSGRGGDHHRAAGELAVIERHKEAAAAIEFQVIGGSEWEWPPVESRQSQKN